MGASFRVPSAECRGLSGWASDQVVRRIAAERAQDILPEFARVANPGPGALPGGGRRQGDGQRGIGGDVEEGMEYFLPSRYLGWEYETPKCLSVHLNFCVPLLAPG